MADVRFDFFLKKVRLNFLIFISLQGIFNFDTVIPCHIMIFHFLYQIKVKVIYKVIFNSYEPKAYDFICLGLGFVCCLMLSSMSLLMYISHSIFIINIQFISLNQT